jgi:NHL repeat.
MEKIYSQDDCNMAKLEWLTRPDDENTVYVADTENNRIQIFVGDGTFQHSFITTSLTGAYLNPVSIDVDINHHLFIAYEGNSPIQEL